MRRPMTSARDIKRLVIGGILAAALNCITLLAVRVWSLHEYAQERKSVRETLDWLREDRRPDKVGAKVWEVATGWAITAYENVCFSEEHTSFCELRRFRVDFEKRLAGDVDLATTDWIWQRLAGTGPHGQHYRRKFEPQYRQDVNYALTNK